MQQVLELSLSVPGGAYFVGVLTTPATRRKPGCGSVLPRGGCVPWDLLPPCLVRVRVCRRGAIPCHRARVQV